METFTLLDTECSALAGHFQLTISDMKSCSPLWEEFLSRSIKMHSTLKGALGTIGSFLDALQRIADHATASRGASTDVGATLTRLCMRHKELLARVRALTSCLLDSSIQPLQSRLDDWKKVTVALDREHTKEYKKARSELKKKTDMVTRLHKKAKKSNKPQTNKILSAGIEEVVAGFTSLRDTERGALKRALLEERSRYCLLASSLTPVLREEVGLVGVLTQVQDILQQLKKHTDDSTVLPPASEQLLLNVKDPSAETAVAWQTPPSSPSSLSGSHRSHRSSLTSIASTAANSQSHGGATLPVGGSPSHHHGRSRSASQSGGLVSVRSQDSGFTSQDTLHRHTISGPTLAAALQASRVSDISNLSQPSSLSSNDGPASLPPHPSHAHHAPPADAAPSSTSSAPSGGVEDVGAPSAAGAWQPHPPQQPTFPDDDTSTESAPAMTQGGHLKAGQRPPKGALLDDRPHTISSAYEKSHVRERPALGPNTFTLPNPSSQSAMRENIVAPMDGCEGGAPSGASSPMSNVSSGNSSSHHHHQQQQQPQHTATISRRSSRSSVLHYHHSASNSQESINSQSSSASGVRSKPPLPSRCSSLERPALPEKKQSTGSSFRQRLPLHHLLHHHHQSKNSSQDGVGEPMEPPSVPDFNKAPPDMIVPQPVYSNMSELGGAGGPECPPIEGENSPHGSISSSGYGSQPSVRNHDDLPTLDEYPLNTSHSASRYAPPQDLHFVHGRHSVAATPEGFRLSTPVTTILEHRGEESGDDQLFEANQNLPHPAPLVRSLTAPNTPTDGQHRSLIPHSLSAHHFQQHQYQQHQYHYSNQQQHYHSNQQQQQYSSHQQQQQHSNQQQYSNQQQHQHFLPPLPPPQTQHTSQYRHGRFSMPALPQEMQHQLQLRHQEIIMQQQQDQQRSSQQNIYAVEAQSAENLRPVSLDPAQKMPGGDLRQPSQGVRNTGSLRRSANGKPPPPIRRTASISTSSSSLNSATAAACCGASSGGARASGVPPPLQHTLSSSSLKNAPTAGLIHSSSSTSLPQHLSSTELSHASSSTSLPQNSSSNLSHFKNVSNSSSSLQNNFHNSSSSISLSNGGGNLPTHDYSNSSSNNGSVMTLSGGDNGCSGSVMTLNGDVQTSSDVGAPVSDVPPSSLRCNGDGAADSDGEVNTPRGSMESFPPPPDFLLEDDTTKTCIADKQSVGDGSENKVAPVSTGHEIHKANVSESLPTITSCISEPNSALSPEELSKEVAKQLAPIYQNKLRSGCSNQLGLGGGNNSSSQTSQNSSPSSLDQLSPLLDDDHPSPPSPCPPSPCPPLNYNPPSTPSPHSSSPQELVKGYSLFGPPEPIQDEGLSKRSVSVSEAVRNLQESKHQPSSPTTTKKTLTSSSQSPTSDQVAVTNNVVTSVTDNHASVEPSLNRRDAARASIISTLSSKMSQQQETSVLGQTGGARSNSQYDPYTQPLPMKLHQDEVMQQVLQQKTDSRQLALNSPNHNTQVHQPSSSPNANSQPLTQQQHLEQLQQQQQHLIHQQQLLHEKHFKQLQSTTSQPLITKPESRAFLATLNSALSQRPTPPQKSQHLRASVSNSTPKPQLKTQLSTPSPTSRTASAGSNKTPLRSTASAPKITKPKRSIVMGTASRANSSPSSSAIPQLNSSSNQSSSRLSRTGSSSSDKFKFRQLIASGRNSSTSNGQPRETAVSSLASSRPKSVPSANSHQVTPAGVSGSNDTSSPRGGGLGSVPNYGHGSSQLREGLLEQIRKGAKLRQTKQIADRSAPRVH